MAKVTIVVGLPGSGKTLLSRSLARGGAKVYEDFLSPEFLSGIGMGAILDDLWSGRDCVLNDPSLCPEGRRVRFAALLQRAVPGVEIGWHFLANDAARCVLNVLGDFWQGRRNDLEARLGEIRRLHGEYVITPGCPIHAVGGSFTLDDVAAGFATRGT